MPIARCLAKYASLAEMVRDQFTISFLSLRTWIGM
jgi:hypothetical protein